LKFSQTEENYLKAIFHLGMEGRKVSTSELAQQLSSQPASITDMMKKLSAKGLLDYQPYYGFSLSPEGRKAALDVVRRHRLWEYFLSEKLGFGWNEVHAVAEELEHVGSKKLIDKLDEYLGFPHFDPHGDPIPDKKGRMKPFSALELTDLPLRQPALVTGIRDQSPELLDYLQGLNIAIGTQVSVTRRNSFDELLQLKVATTSCTLSMKLAKHLLVKKI
jgi:DtxR family Mn-dependent transcriptional regulator